MIRSTAVPIICFIFLIDFFLFATKAHAIGLRPTLMSGLMQQPSSQYYHLMYGFTTELRLINSWGVRTTYIERPAFTNAGFVDQDFIAYVDTGASFFKKDKFEILSYIGVGRAWGYIKEVPIESGQTRRRNDYKLNVVSLSMEAAYNNDFIDTKIGHSMHIGQGDSAQTNAKVVWPYSTYYLSFSKMIGPAK